MDTTTAIPAGFRGAGARLTQADVDRAAQVLGITSRIVQAIASVEAANMGFLPDGRPQLLYEAHVFHDLTDGRFDATAPDLSSPVWNPSLYGPGGAPQYGRLARAMLLDSEAGLQSATWGMFQLLGRNFKALGYASVDAFVAAMCESEGHQLDGFVAYCLVNNLGIALQQQEWLIFAEGYNGSGAPNLYASRLIAAVNSGKFPQLPPGPTDPPPPLPPGPPPAGAAIPVKLRRGMEMVIPGVRGLGEDGQPYALSSGMFVSQDAQVASLAVTSGDPGTGQTIEISSGRARGETTISCGQVLTFDVTVEDPALARIVIDMTKAVLKPVPTAAAAALMVMMMAVSPTSDRGIDVKGLTIVETRGEKGVVAEPNDTMWENKKISSVFFPHPDRVSEGERLCLDDIHQPPTAIERCLRWVHASRR